MGCTIPRGVDSHAERKGDSAQLSHHIPMRASLLTTCALIGFTTGLRAQDTTSAAPDTGYVEYAESPISLPLGIGLRIPSYDRVNGLALPWGPKLDLSEDKLQLDALVTYRSNLGKWDPSLEGFVRFGDANELKVYVGRGTFTNDSWIRTDLVNSLASIGVGSDARNFFRGDRVTARFTHTLTNGSLTLTPFIGGIIERDWSTGSIVAPRSPWSFFGKNGVLQMKRANPRVKTGRISSFVAGSGFALSRGGVDAKLDATVEHSFKTSLTADCSGLPTDAACARPPLDFTQVTLHSQVDFATFGSQTFSFMGHALLGTSNIAPPQRFGYLGGSGTLATVNLLALGGDRLLYVPAGYIVALGQIHV